MVRYRGHLFVHLCGSSDASDDDSEMSPGSAADAESCFRDECSSTPRTIPHEGHERWERHRPNSARVFHTIHRYPQPWSRLTYTSRRKALTRTGDSGSIPPLWELGPEESEASTERVALRPW